MLLAAMETSPGDSQGQFLGPSGLGFWGFGGLGVKVRGSGFRV